MSYQHIVQYYETDKMGITHHSNYIRWMEEARVSFFAEYGWDYKTLEDSGIASPVISVSCNYKKPTTFSDKVDIHVSIKQLSNVKLLLGYTMECNGVVVCEAESSHCFVDREGRIVRAKRDYPEFYSTLESLLQEQNDAT